MTTADTQRLDRLKTALSAIEPYLKDGTFAEAPAALADEYADAILDAPATYWVEVERLEPGTGFALLGWAQDRSDRRDYPEFFAMLAELGRIRDEQGEEAAAASGHAELCVKMMSAAPPRYWDEAETILAEALPTATHVTEDGQPVYSAQQLADKLRVTIEDVEAGIQRLEDMGLLDCRHTGPVHPVQ
ncbi:MAG: hypothetical protein LWW96_18960 [Acidovorax sp.]|uniref:hypothetical protein n=1 Tax=Acidovorax sp. TaxID=1872122 RepID=UPI0025BEF2F0|nr:hypothetical protein [Acidovorax sp.]MCE1194230.1 hypothetical protein [Acidovorax sp.]